MIHTADVRITLTESTYQYICQEYGQTKMIRQYSIRDFAADGLTDVRLYTFMANNTTRYYLRVTMNLQHVFSGRYDPLALYDGADYQILAHRFDTLMSSVTTAPLPSLSDWTVCRIDYAFDSKLAPGKEHGTPSEYVAMAKRGLSPQRAMLVERDGWVSCREENSSVRINCYDKMLEIQQRQYLFDNDVLDRAQHVLRFEVQCLTPKIKRVARKAEISGRPLEFFVNVHVWRQIIGEYGRRVIGEESYYSVHNAALILRRCAFMPNGKRLRSDVITNLIDFFKAIDTVGGLGAAINIWKEQHSIRIHWTTTDKNVCLGDNQRRARMRQLRQIGINPVPIPTEMRRGKLVNPLWKFWEGEDLG